MTVGLSTRGGGGGGSGQANKCTSTIVDSLKCFLDPAHYSGTLERGSMHVHLWDRGC